MKTASIPVKYLAVAAMLVAVILGLIKLDVWYTTRQSAAEDGMSSPELEPSSREAGAAPRPENSDIEAAA